MAFNTSGSAPSASNIDPNNLTPAEKAEYDAGYQKAIETIRQIKEQAQNQSNGSQGGMPIPGGNNQQNQNSQGSGQQQTSQQNQQSGGNGQGKKSQSDIDKDIEKGIYTIAKEELDEHKTFNPNDITDSKKMKDLANDAGQSIEQRTQSEKIGDKLDAIKNAFGDVFKGKGQRGSAGGSSSLWDKIVEACEVGKPKINWRQELQHIMKQPKAGTYNSWNKRRYGNPHDQIRRYVKDKERKTIEDGGLSEIFYLIDSSGSMCIGEGNKMFDNLMTEILGIEEAANVKHSRLTYFGTGVIEPEMIRYWHRDEGKRLTGAMKEQILQDCALRPGDLGGGTDITGSTIQITELGKPYYSSHHPTTTIIVLTDGDDCGEIGRNFDQLEDRVRDHIFFLIINDLKQAESHVETLIKNGIPETNVFAVDRSEFEK